MFLRIAFSFLICTQALAADSPASATSAEGEIRMSLQRWMDATNRGDYAAAMDVWAPDLIGWPPDGEDDTYARERAYADKGGPVEATYQLTINEIIVDTSMAVVRDTWQQTMKRGADAGKTTVFRSVEIWRRQPDGHWRISRWIDGPERPAPTAR